MSLPTSLLAYTDCLEAMDRCLENTRGVRIKMLDEGAGWFLRMRLHYARSLDRERNRQVYAEQRDNPMYGCSIYDPIVAKLRFVDGSWWLYLMKVDSKDMEIEPVDSLPPPAPRIEHRPQLQITVQRGDGSEMQGEVLPPVKRRV